MFKTKLIINSDLIEIKNELEHLLEEIKTFIKKKDLLFEIKLILNELVINSAIHGNELDKKKKVRLDLEIDNKAMKLEIKDEGNGFIYDKNVYNPLELTSSGRGLVIVDGLSDEFFIDNNKVSLVKYF